MENEKKIFEEILHGMQGGVWVSDRDDVIFYANRGMAIIAGVPESRIVGVNVLTGLSQVMVHSLKLLYLQAKETLEPRYFDAVRVVTQSGRETYQSGWLIPRVRDNAFNGMICTVEDVTDRIRAEEALRASEAHFRFITENMSDVAFIQDMNFRTTYVSPSVEMVLGFTPEERLRQTVQEQVTPESLKKIFDMLAVEMEKERSGTADPNRRLIVELDFYHRNGTIRNLEVLISGIRDERGKLTGIHGLARDVTERKKLESKTLQMRKMEAIGKLASGAAHEIRNPLNILSLRLQMLRLTGKDRDRDVLEAIDVCQEQIGRITQVLDGLQDFSRIPETRLGRCDLNEIVRKVVDSRAERFRERGITADVRLGENVPPLMLDREKIVILLEHLIANAEEAMKDRDKRLLEISTEWVASCDTGGCCARITVSDTGHGIREENMSRIFDPFFTTREPGRGKGLGLAVAYGIVTDHGGIIRAENNREGGATFIVELPAEQRME